MAGDGEEETEYQSDPEEAKLSLKMRRKEASDDEEEKKGEGNGQSREDTKSARAGVASDGESDGQGGAADYDDGELEVDEEEEEYYDEEEYEEEMMAEEEYGENGLEVDGPGESEVPEAMGRDEDVELGESSEGHGHGHDGRSQLEEEEKKESEPFAVPTAGAFYMHDDRFSDNVGGRRRHTFGARKLWESKDDRKWGHDKFEEMNMKERQYHEGRKSSRGHPRGRGRGRGSDHGYVRGNRLRPYNDNNNQNIAPKSVRGRGPRRYQALTKGRSEAPIQQNKQSQKPLDKASYASSGRVNTSAPHVDSDPIPSKRVASNLNSASPPFYPSGASNKDNALTQKRDDQTANANRNIHPPMQESLPLQQSNSSSRGKNVVDSIGIEKLYIDDPALARPLRNTHLPSASLSTNAPHSRGHSRGAAISGSNSFLTSPTENQVSKTSSAGQTRPSQQTHVQGRGQPSFPASAQQLGPQPSNASQGSSPPQAGFSMTESESGEADSLTESSRSKTVFVGKGKGNAAGGGRGPFLYSGAPLMGSGGSVGANHGDQNFPGTPAFLPVMQFGGQHPGGIGVPAVGMAFPGYVAQPQHGLGNSEMTWLPVLTGPAGALSASYYPPYIAVDGSYHARPAGQMPALPASSKDNNVNKSKNELKPQQKSDLVNDEFSQRQNKPRRYSEMSFGQ